MYQIFVTIHLLGVVLGAGAAFISDALFFGTFRDHKIEKNELNLMKITSSIVWIGLFIMIISGYIMVQLGNFTLLSSQFFQFKMVLVGIIILNGIVFHTIHLKFLNKMIAMKKIDDDIEKIKVRKSFKLIFISGSISAVTWLSVILIASLKHTGAPFSLFLYSYLLTLIFSLLAGQFIIHKIFPKHQKPKHAFKKGVFPYLLIFIIALVILILKLF